MAMQDYSTYQSQFIIDTGLDWKTNVDTFIQYCQARILDKIMTQQEDLMTKLIAKVGDIKLV